MDNYREYCVVAVKRSKWGNEYKELFRGRRKDCKRFVSAYGGEEREIVISSVAHDLCIKEVKDDNSVCNTIDINDSFYKDSWNKFFDKVSGFMTRYEMEQKVKDYITSDDHRLEDYSDIEICSKRDYGDAYELMDKRVKHSTDEELMAFCNAIDTDTVDYMVHGCR